MGVGSYASSSILHPAHMCHACYIDTYISDQQAIAWSWQYLEGGWPEGSKKIMRIK